MRIIRTAKGMQRLAQQWRRGGERVAFVPTMGYLHAGHESLMHRARKEAGPRGKVVASIYVNPTQFAPTEDLGKYPRDFARDRRLCARAGVDALFAPGDGEIYAADQSVFVVEERLAKGMEGASRPSHFRGVATVVAKLFNLTLPDVAIFGAKDFQQAAVIRRVARDLNFPVKIVVAETVREPDGLAMSSRNKYLSAEERPQALALVRAIWAAREAVGKGGAKSRVLKERLRKKIEENPAARVDYIEFFDPETLEPEVDVRVGTRMALAVFVGKTRLIDNAEL